MTPEITTERGLDGSFRWLVKLDGTHIGMAEAVPKPDLVTPSRVYISIINIAVAYQGRSFGQQLVAHIVRDLAGQPLPAYLKVAKDNPRACHIYQKMGGVAGDCGQSTHLYYWWNRAA